MSETTEPSDAFTTLDDYTSGAMPDTDAEAFEQALFLRAAHGEAPEAELGEQLRRLAEWAQRRGGFKPYFSRADVDALLASGLRVTYADFGAADHPVDIPPFERGLDFYVYRVGVDVRGQTDVDVIVETADGRHIKTFRDVGYDPADGAIHGVCEAPLAELAFRSGPLRWKLMVGHGAERRKLAELETRPVG